MSEKHTHRFHELENIINNLLNSSNAAAGLNSRVKKIRQGYQLLKTPKSTLSPYKGEDKVFLWSDTKVKEVDRWLTFNEANWQLLLKSIKKPWEARSRKWTLFHHGVAHGHDWDIPEFNHALVALRDHHGRTTLHIALLTGQSYEYLTKLIEYRVDVNEKHNGDPPLILAIKNMDEPAVTALLGCDDLDITATDELGNTALHWAAYTSQSRMIAKVLDAYGNKVNWDEKKVKDFVMKENTVRRNGVEKHLTAIVLAIESTAYLGARLMLEFAPYNKLDLLVQCAELKENYGFEIILEHFHHAKEFLTEHAVSLVNAILDTGNVDLLAKLIEHHRWIAMPLLQSKFLVAAAEHGRWDFFRAIAVADATQHEAKTKDFSVDTKEIHQVFEDGIAKAGQLAIKNKDFGFIDQVFKWSYIVDNAAALKSLARFLDTEICKVWNSETKDVRLARFLGRFLSRAILKLYSFSGPENGALMHALGDLKTFDFAFPSQPEEQEAIVENFQRQFNL